jgi:hypothetical protein
VLTIAIPIPAAAAISPPAIHNPTRRSLDTGDIADTGDTGGAVRAGGANWPALAPSVVGVGGPVPAPGASAFGGTGVPPAGIFAVGRM